MGLACDFYRSTVGKKVVMALSGLVLVGFVLGHMLGNLKIFAVIDPHTGLYKLDEYAAMLREIGAAMLGHSTFLWIVRGVLLIALIAHVGSGVQLSVLNRRAKPVRPAVKSYGSSNAASRTMAYGGLALLVFIVLHLLHFTTGTIHHHGFEDGKVYSNVLSAFQSRSTAGLYVLAMAFLAMHLYHGTWSMFQTLGVDTPSWNKGIRLIAKGIATILFIGFSAVPVAATLGYLPAPVATVNSTISK